MSLETLQALDSVIDHQALLTRCLNKVDFAERMLNLFAGRCGIELTELEQAFANNDMDSVRRIAHRMAGASANAAAVAMQASATNLRHAADSGSTDKAAECLSELRREWDRFTSAVSAHQTGSTGQTSSNPQAT